MTSTRALQDQRLLPRLAAVALTAAGIAHLVAIPEHGLHSTVHGAVMGGAAAAEVLLGVALLSRATLKVSGASVLLAAGLIALWGITRLLPAPFGHGVEEIEALGMTTKGLEAGTIALLITWRTLQLRRSVFLPASEAGWLFLVALVTALAIYVAGMAAHSATRGLSAPDHAHEAPEHAPDHETRSSARQ